MALEYESQQYSSGTYTAVQVVDIDQDGKPEVLAGHRDNNSIEIWKYHPASNSLNLASSIPFSYHVHDFQVADFDQDGDLDVVAGIRFDGLEYAQNNGNVTWSVSSIDWTYSWRVQVADFDQDGNLDILDGVDTTYGLKIFYGNGSGSFVEGTAPVWGGRGLTVNSVDFNQDGRTDIIGFKESEGSGAPNELKAFLNLGGRNWSTSVGPSTPISEYPLRDFTLANVSAGDVDKNGYIDQVVVQEDQSNPNTSSDVLIFRGNSSGSNLIWTPQLLDTIPGLALNAGFADLNDDGNLDVYVGWETSPNLYLYFGDGQGNFTKQTITLSGSGPNLHALDVSDINGDGRSDIVTASGGLDNPQGFLVLFQTSSTPNVINGTNGKDNLIGTSGTDEINGRNGKDRLTGLEGNDYLNGDNGADTLNGANPNVEYPGRGEIDVLTGGRGPDTFILGGTNKPYYDDSNHATHGEQDYALVKDFSNEDAIQLTGRQGIYKLKSGFTLDGTTGTGIFLKDQVNELIGFVQGATGLSLGSNNFRFV